MSREYTYEKMYELKVQPQAVEEIINSMIEMHPPERNFSLSELPHSFYVVYCDCGDGDVLGEETSDAFYNELLPRVVFVDPYFKKSLWKNISHEIVHDLQQILYVFMDGYEVPYKERWEEKMAFSLEDKVSDILQQNKLSYRIKSRDHEKIDSFLMDELEKNDETYDLFEAEAVFARM